MLSRKEKNMRWSRRFIGGVGILVVVAVVGVGAAMGLSGGSSSIHRTTVKTARVLGRTALVTPKGMTLYSLSAEVHGRFICKNSACLALWKPLVVARGTKPTGAKHLGTIRRPGGKIQVTYRGKPLYTFVQDRKPGDAKGEGFKDVGTWHVARTGSTSVMAPTQTTTSPGYTQTTTSPGYGY
jgi:predicted lipoprotein with Yx(FWY)xxD motif